MRRDVRGAAVTVAAVTASMLSSIFVLGANGHVPGDHVIHPSVLAGVSCFVSIGAAIALRWRHRAPVVVTGIALVPSLFLLSDSLAALIALAALVASRKDRVLWAGTALVYIATSLAVWRDARRHPQVTIVGDLIGARTTVGQIIWVLLIAAVLTAIPLAVGRNHRVKRDLARREIEERHLRAELARREERARIAREMHDLLGHRLSLLSLQAGALEVSDSSSTEAAQTVRTTARQSLEDLRQVIGVLRDGDGFTDRDAAAGRPEHHRELGLADIPELIANTRRSGLAVNTTILLSDVADAPGPLGTAAYRIIQESLTNVLKHAPGATAEVSVRGGPGVGLAMEVSNALPDPGGERPPGSGAGLTGIAERVALIGGNVSAGPTNENMFAVRAWLPWPRP